MIAGPETPFSPEELDSLRLFLDLGGSMLVLLDPSSPITLDELPLGNFVELEGEPADIDSFAGLLGFNRADYINDSYRALHLRQREEAGETGEPTELIFPGEAGP